ncbi:MAG TPA: recombinase family protein [Tepidisphaeraceae bacterium]|jgi:DNA invertase Pin-like site-specific DNA recombinase|nr:recombinase family protein [Tepidisphaeraceae bacterium]
MNNETKFFLYARKSTDDTSRQVRSIDDQIAELQELAEREHLEIVEIFIEKQTAKKPGRPIFNAMLDRIEKGEAKGILAWHPDRLSRNSVDAGKIIWFIDTKVITALRFPTYWFEPTAQGKFTLSIMLTQSKYYVDNLSENIQRGQRQKVKNGLWPMMAPVGYLNDRQSRGIIPDPKRRSLIRKAFELYATGDYTIDRLQEKVNELGLIARNGEPLCRAQYHRILQNPIYCGIINYGGAYHEGKHEPLVTKSLFDKVQEIMARKSKPKTPELKPYLYRGVFRCGECGCFVTTETQKGNNYLRCSKRVKKDCSQPYMREEILSEQVADYLRCIALPIETADWMISELQIERDTETASRQKAMHSMQAQLQESDEKLDLLMNAYLDKSISLDEYKNAKTRLVNEKQELKDKKTALEANGGNWFEPAIRFVKAAKTTGFLAETGTDEEKRDFLKKVGSNLTIRNRHLSVNPRGAWKLVVDQGSFAQHNTAPSHDGAVSVGEIHQNLQKRRR